MKCFLIACLLLVTASALHAQTTVFVDPALGCNGQTPCFATIQQGVNSAGGGDSTVNIFPGTYNESVDISLMGTTGGLMQGNLILQGVDAVGSPSVGLANISGTGGVLGEAIWNSVNPFPFGLTVNGINITSASTDAMDIEGISGAVTLTDLEATNALFDGIDIRAQGNVTLTRVNADGNGNDGIQIVVEDAGNVIITDSTASNNTSDNDPSVEDDDDGIAIDLHDGFIQLTNVTVADNGDDGIRIRPFSTFSLITDPDTGLLVVDDTDFDFSTISSITLDNVLMSGNGSQSAETGDGINVRNVFEINFFDGVADRTVRNYGSIIDIDILFSIAEDNGSDGFQLEATTNGDVTVMDTISRRNGTDGYEINSGEVPSLSPTSDDISNYTIATLDTLTMIRSQAIDNDNDGFQLESEDGPNSRELVNNITLQDTVASGNGAVGTSDGYELGALNQVSLTRVTAINNGGPDDSSGDGIEIGSGADANYTPQTIIANDIVAINNSDDNLEFQAFGNITVSSVIARDNSSPNDEDDGIELETIDGGNILLRDCNVSGMFGDGLDLNARNGGSITVLRCNVTGNAQDGIDTVKSSEDDGTISADGANNSAVNIQSVFVSGNGDDGIQTASLMGPVTIAGSCVDGEPSSGIFVMQTAGDLNITDSATLANSGEGIRLRDLNAGTYSIDGNNIAGNTNGIFSDSFGTIDASGSFWGNATGPTDPANPGGTGDSIIDGSNGGIGIVNFTPFLTTPAPFAPDCTPVVTDLPDIPDLAITKTGTGGFEGIQVTYTITVTNPGTVDVIGATVTDILPANLNNANWSCLATGGAACTANGSGDISDTADIPVGGSLVYTLTADILALEGETVTNTATVATPAGVVDGIPPNNSATDSFLSGLFIDGFEG